MAKSVLKLELKQKYIKINFQKLLNCKKCVTVVCNSHGL